MICNTIQKKMLFYAEGSLPKAEIELVASHLKTCGACQAKLSYIQEFEVMLNEQQNITPIPFLYTRVKARMERNATVPQRAPWQWALSVAAVLAIGVVFGTLVGNATVSDLNRPAATYAINDLFNDINLEGIEYRILND